MGKAKKRTKEDKEAAELARDKYLKTMREERAEREKKVRKEFDWARLEIDKIKRGVFAAAQELNMDAILEDETMAKHLIEFGLAMLMFVKWKAPWDGGIEDMLRAELQAREDIIRDETYEVLGKETIRTMQFYMDFYKRIMMFAMPAMKDPILLDDASRDGPYEAFRSAMLR